MNRIAQRTGSAESLGRAMFASAIAIGGCTEPGAGGTGAADGTSSTPTTGAAEPGGTGSTSSSTPSGTSSRPSSTGPVAADSGLESDGDGGIKLDVALPDGGPGSDCVPAAGPATLRGTVYAPNGTTPVSGALVYLTVADPEPIPDEVYCNTCTELACGIPFAFTEPDGTFEIAAPEGPRTLVVEKGQFRRETAIELPVGVTDADVAWSTLPSRRDPAAGEYIPNIALAWGSWDRMEDLLAKLGLAQSTPWGAFDDTVMPAFDVYSRYPEDSDPFAVGHIEELLSDPLALQRYHILFLACTGQQFELAELQNLRDWVAAGGRVYATDLDAYPFGDAFEQYQTFGDIGFFPGLGQPWPGRVEDDGLAQWLETFGYGALIELEDNASSIAALHPVLVDDMMGGEVDVGHYTWLSAANQAIDGGPGDAWTPAAVSGQFGCGRIMYTTYHTTSIPHPDFYAQELTMLYLILEAGVCQSPAGIPAG